MARDLLDILYLTTPGAEARLSGDSADIETEGQPGRNVPLQNIASIVAMEGVRVSLPLAVRAAELGKPVTILDTTGQVRARISNPLAGAAELRLAQYGSYASLPRRLELASMLLQGKLLNLESGLDRMIARRLAPAAEAKREVMNGLALLQLANSMPGLLGIEGAATMAYWGAFGAGIHPRIQNGTWRGRSRRPPLDPMNALLSFFSTILTHECEGALETMGLDPAVGYLHELRSGRASLACDLVEEMRPALVDRFCLGLAAKGTVDHTSFEARESGIYLAVSGRKAALAAWEKRKKRLVPYPGFVEPVPIGLIPFLRAQALAQAIRGQTAYEPMDWN